MRISALFIMMILFLGHAKAEDTEYGLGLGYIAPNRASFQSYAANVTVISPASSTDDAGSIVENYGPGFTLDLQVKNTYSKKWGFWLGLKFISPVNLTSSTIKRTTGTTDSTYVGSYDTLQTSDVNANFFYIFNDTYVGLGVNQSMHIYSPAPLAGFQQKASATGGVGYQLSIGLMLHKEVHLEAAIIQHALAISGSATAANGSIKYNLSGGNILSTTAGLIFYF